MTDKPILDKLLLLIDEFTKGNKKKFAEILKVTPSYIDRWINQGILPSAKQLTNIHDKLKININWLLTGEGEMFIKKESPLTVHEALVGYGYNLKEREYIDKLVTIFRTKDTDTKIAIMQNIDTFLKVPADIKGKDTLKKKAG